MYTIVFTSPVQVKDEALICNSLFARGLEILHLRKPDFDKSGYEKFIQQIEPRYHNRIMIHNYYDLARNYQLRGIHVKSYATDHVDQYAGIPYISTSCHTLDEIEKLSFSPAYCFLSPVFDSISKEGYKSRFSEAELAKIKIYNRSFPIIALGGISPANLNLCRDYGFDGVAVLGYIWQQNDEAIQRFVRLTTPSVMSIAGFDPSSGAGITADLKTFEACGTYGFGACSAVTFQNQDTYTGTHWITFDEIRRQCDLQFKYHKPRYVKIGLIEHFDLLDSLTEYLTAVLPNVRIVWDPILKASAGFRFHKQQHQQGTEQWNRILNRLYLITPNSDELRYLFGEPVNPEVLQQLCRQFQLHILWKGGHNDEILSTDRLITPDAIHTFSVQRGKYEKHGTGCILSAALMAALAHGDPLATACSKAQLYVSQLINSNHSKLGYHSIGTVLSTLKPSITDNHLQYITDHKPGMTVCEQVEAVCRGGIRWIQLRMKEATDEEWLREGRLVGEICRRYNALFIINDRVDIARQLNADGVHLGKEDMNPVQAREILGNDKIIGVTCNTYNDIIQCSKQPVNYVGLGPFAFTATKKKLNPVLGLACYIQTIVQMRLNNIQLPVFAVGGINETNLIPLLRTGIQGVALSGLIKNSNDLTGTTAGVIQTISNGLSDSTPDRSHSTI